MSNQTSEASPAQSRHSISRSPLACLNCRKSKAKCDGLVPSALAKRVATASSPSGAFPAEVRGYEEDGDVGVAAVEPVPAEVKCWRCERLGLECTWKPCHRSGRPSKGHQQKKRSLDTAFGRGQGKDDTTSAFAGHPCDSSDENMAASATGQMFVDANPLVSLLSGEEGITAFSTSHPDSSPSSGLSGQYTLEELINSSSFPDAAMSEALQTFFATGPQLCTQEEGTQEGEEIAPILSPSTPSNQLAVMRKRIQQNPNMSSNEEKTLANTTSPMDLGVARFFSGIGLALPLYKHRADYTTRAHHCNAQQFAMAALGHALYEGSAGPSFLADRKRSIEYVESRAFQNGLRSTEMPVLIAHISALILLVYVDYGLEESDLLLQHLNQARNAAVTSALPYLDTQPTSAVSTLSEIEEAARRTWWELWVLDCILDVVSGGQVKRQLADIHGQVKYPGEGDAKERTMWSIRVRSVSLLIDAVSASKYGFDINRLQAANRIQSDAISEAQQLFLATVREQRQVNENLPEDLSFSLSRRTILFDCLMMLYAGQIHLHRMFWFADLTLDLASCSFQRKTQELTSVAPQGPERRADLIEASVEKIVHAADSILSLMRFDTDTFFRNSLDASQDMRSNTKSLPIYSSHWPPIGCCQMVASYGLVVGVAASPKGRMSAPDDHDPCSTATDTDDSSFDHQMANGRILSSTLKDGGDVWRTEQSISSIGMAESSLGVLAEVWPVAKTYRNEVHQCRLAISQALA